MILSPADRERLRAAFEKRIGNTALRSDITVDDVCMNLVLAIPALLETLDGMEADEIAAEGQRDAALRDLATANASIATLTAQLEADPCP